MKKILIINTIGMGYEGISTVIFNYLEHMDRNDFDFHFPIFQDTNTEIISKIRSLGVPHMISNRKQNLINYLLSINEILKEGYDVVHIHGNSGTMLFEVLISKINRVKKIIVHCHTEAANNAACGGAMIPLFTLGIPGSPVTAILYGALLMHGLQPGSDLFTGSKAPTTYAIFLGFLFANVLMGIIGVSMARQMARVCLVPNSVLVPIIVALSCIGTYALSNSMYEVIIMLVFGLIGYLMKIYGFEPAPLVLGVVLADILESNFRRTLIMAAPKGGLIPYFFSRPIAIIILLVIIGFAMVPVLKNVLTKKQKQ